MNEIELILTDIFNCSRMDLYLNSKSLIFDKNKLNRIDSILKRRSSSSPLPYILGNVEFAGLEFKVDKNALIPRPETEILVEEVVRIAKEYSKPKLNILDIGTGSGCIAISLAKFINNAKVTAVDISTKALALAKENVKLHKLDKGIKFVKSDIFSSSIFKKYPKFDIIVSNPPYIKTKEIGLFDYSITKEPRIALDGGKDGLVFYRRLAKQAKIFLKRDGFILLEIGEEQAQSIKEIFKKDYIIEKIIKDYNNRDRIVIIRKG